MQFLCAFVILGFLCVFTKKPTLDWKSTCKLMLLGIVNTLSSLTYYLAISYLTVGSAVAIQFQYVWIVVAFQAISERKLPRPIVIIAVILVIAGTLFCSGLVDEFISESSKAHPIGIAFALVCAFTYALFIFFNGKVASDQPPVIEDLYYHNRWPFRLCPNRRRYISAAHICWSKCFQEVF